MTTEYSGSGDLRRSLELLWQGRERASRGPKPGLTLERIVAAAVGLADREGLAALSMRKVAAELGVGTMSLYRYVPGKGELLDLMLDHVNQVPGANPVPGEGDAHLGAGWRIAMEHLAWHTWRLYHRHPWLLQVNQARPILGPNALAGFDRTLQSLDGLGLTDQEKVSVLLAIDHYVTGTARTYILEQQASEVSGVSDEEHWAAQEPMLIDAMESGSYPEVAKLSEDVFRIDGAEVLEFGLGHLLDGFERFIESRSSR